MTELPCRARPERWFSKDRSELGLAVHACLVHCPRLAECRLEPPAVEGVIGAVLFNHRGEEHAHQPKPVLCVPCLAEAAPPVHGTERGYSRHRRAGEPPCVPCRNAHNAGTLASKRRRAKRPKEPAPPEDIYEERRRILVDALKTT